MNDSGVRIIEDFVGCLPEAKAEIRLFSKSITDKPLIKPSQVQNELAPEGHVGPLSGLDLSHTPLLVQPNISPLER
jgi:hypothetical protein